MIFRILISLVLIAVPGGVYYLYGYQIAMITGLCEIIFLVVSTREDVLELKKKEAK